MPQSPVFWLAIYVVGLIGTTFFFQWQRTALAIVRNASVSEGCRASLLPGWFKVFWIFRLLGWAAVAGLYLPFGWWGVGVGAVVWLLPTALPLPFNLYLPLCRRYWKVKRPELEMVRPKSTAVAIDRALQSAEEELSVWS